MPASQLASEQGCEQANSSKPRPLIFVLSRVHMVDGAARRIEKRIYHVTYEFSKGTESVFHFGTTTAVCSCSNTAVIMSAIMEMKYFSTAPCGYCARSVACSLVFPVSCETNPTRTVVAVEFSKRISRNSNFNDRSRFDVGERYRALRINDVGGNSSAAFCFRARRNSFYLP